MNRVILIGRLTKDPDVRYSQSGMSIARYTVAVDRYKDETADFIPCIAFGKTAEAAEKYLAKGNRVAVSGRIQTGSYTNKDGYKVYTTDVVVENQEFIDNRAKVQEEPAPAPTDDLMAVPAPAQDAPPPPPPGGGDDP